MQKYCRTSSGKIQTITDINRIPVNYAAEKMQEELNRLKEGGESLDSKRPTPSNQPGRFSQLQTKELNSARTVKAKPNLIKSNKPNTVGTANPNIVKAAMSNSIGTAKLDLVKASKSF